MFNYSVCDFIMFFVYAIVSASILLAISDKIAVFSCKRRTWIYVGFFIITFIPINGCSWVMALRGLLGDLSIVSICLILYWCFSFILRRTAKLPIIPMAVVSVMGFFLYLSVFAVVPFDLYVWGFDFRIFHTVLMIFALLLWRYSTAPAAIIFLVMLAWQFDLLQVDNGWNYIMDLPLFLFCLVYWLRKALQYILLLRQQ